MYAGCRNADKPRVSYQECALKSQQLNTGAVPETYGAGADVDFTSGQRVF